MQPFGLKPQRIERSRVNVTQVMLTPTASGQTITAHNTMSASADAFACARALSDTAACLPLITYRRMRGFRAVYPTRSTSPERMSHSDQAM